jgi:hypothetical protein
MSLSDELDGLVASYRCDTCEWLASRTADEQARIDERMRAFSSADRIEVYGRYTDLYRVCTRYGLKATIDQFRHHCRAHVAN